MIVHTLNPQKIFVFSIIYKVPKKMFSLKKTLTRDDPKKYNKTKIEISSIKQPNNKYKDIESFLQKVTHLNISE